MTKEDGKQPTREEVLTQKFLDNADDQNLYRLTVDEASKRAQAIVKKEPRPLGETATRLLNESRATATEAQENAYNAQLALDMESQSFLPTGPKETIIEFRVRNDRERVDKLFRNAGIVAFDGGSQVKGSDRLPVIGRATADATERLMEKGAPRGRSPMESEPIARGRLIRGR